MESRKEGGGREVWTESDMKGWRGEEVQTETQAKSLLDALESMYMYTNKKKYQHNVKTKFNFIRLTP